MASFAEMLVELEGAHERELGKLQHEIAALKAQLRSVCQEPLPLEPPSKEENVSFTPETTAEERTIDDPEVTFEPAPTLTPHRTVTVESLMPKSPVFMPQHTSSSSTMGMGRYRTEEIDWKASLARRITNFFSRETVEPKDIVFQDLCIQMYPGRQWGSLTTRQRVNLIRKALRPQHYLFNPNSECIRCWDMIIASGLLFSAIVTPYEVVFLHASGNYTILFSINFLIDALFLVDLVLQFFLKVEVQRPHKGGCIMLRDPKRLRMRYLKSWFLVDVVSIIPFDLIMEQITSATDIPRKAKLVRCIKLLRVIKLSRIVRTSRLLNRWRNDIMLKFTTQRLLCFLCFLLLLSHWIACAWGFTGISLAEEFCDGPGQLADLDPGGISIGGVSWVTDLYLSTNKKLSPDTPCNHFHVYVASLHWAVMTITSTGYGDIVPVRVEEYIICTLGMLTGGVLWAYVIGSISSIISNRSTVDRNFELNTDLLNYVMTEARVPTVDRRKYRQCLREAKCHDRRMCFAQIAGHLSPLLRKRLLFHLTKDSIVEVSYFRTAPLEFAMEIAAAVLPKFFSRGEPLASVRSCLCLMDRGTVVHNGVILVPPRVFNEDFIVSRAAFWSESVTLSLTFTQVLILPRETMQELLKPFPEFAATVRRHAVRLAFCRALALTVRRHHYLFSQRRKDCTSLSLTFTDACNAGGYAVPKPFFLSSLSL